MADERLSNLPVVTMLSDDSVVYSALFNVGAYSSVGITYNSLVTQLASDITPDLSDVLDNGNSAGVNQIDMNSQKIINVDEPTDDQDAATKFYVDNATGVQQDLNSVLLAGNSAGANDINMNGNDLTAVNNIVGGASLGIGATDVGIDASDDLSLNASGDISISSTNIDINGTIDMNSFEITGLELVPSLPSSATSKEYVDNQIGVSQNLSGVLSVGNSAGAFDIDMSGNDILNIHTMSSNEINLSAATVFRVNSPITNFISPQVQFSLNGGSFGFFNGTVNFNNQESGGVPLPVNPDQIANKEYVDGVLATSSFANIFPAGNFANNPWQNGESLPNIGFGNSTVRTADRVFFERIGNVPLTAAADINRVELPAYLPDESPSNVALRLESDTVINFSSGAYTGLRFSINGLDMAGLEGTNAGFIIVSFAISASVGAEGTYGLSVSHPNGGGAPLNYVVEVNVTNNTTFMSFAIPTPPVLFGDAISGDSAESMTFRICTGSGTDFHGAADSWSSSDIRTTASQGNLFDSASNRLFLSELSICSSNINSVALHPLDVSSHTREEVVDHCHAYYQKSWLNGVAPAQTLTTNGAVYVRNEPASTATGSMYYTHNFSTEFIRSPSVSFYSPNDNALNMWGRVPFPGVGINLPTQIIYISTKGFVVTNNPGAGAAASTYNLHWVFDTSL